MVVSGPMKDAAWSENNYMGYHYNRGVVAGPGGGYRAYTGGKGGGGSSSSSSYTLPYRVPDDPKKVFIGGLPPCADNSNNDIYLKTIPWPLFRQFDSYALTIRQCSEL